jgi:hypothetical protein
VLGREWKGSIWGQENRDGKGQEEGRKEVRGM